MKKEATLPQSRQEWMEYLHRSMSNGIRAGKSKAPRAWLETRGLSIEATGACFNSGQIHHRKSEEFKQALAEVGFMQRSHVGVNCDTTPYTVFGIFSIMFPLKNQQGQVTNFYSIRIKSGNTAYMNQEQGLYPEYPHELTKRLYIVNTVMEAASLLESKVLDNREAVIALHDGRIEEEHRQAINGLTFLKEIIYVDTPLVIPEKEDKIWDRKKKHA